MSNWSIFIPGVTLIFILYFQFLNIIFSGRKEKYRIARRNIPERREYFLTGLNLLIFAATGFLLGIAISDGKTKIYIPSEFNFSALAYGIFIFFLALGIQDIYFYICHRLLHYKFIFHYIHSHHHQSHQPNAWSALSFHPLEGILQIGIIPIIAFILPMSEFVLHLFTAFLLFITIYGHAGYELRAKRWKGFSIFNTSLHHFQHHKFERYNYGFYLNIWDRMFNTNYPWYKKDLEEFAGRQ